MYFYRYKNAALPVNISSGKCACFKDSILRQNHVGQKLRKWKSSHSAKDIQRKLSFSINNRINI